MDLDDIDELRKSRVAHRRAHQLSVDRLLLENANYALKCHRLARKRRLQRPCEFTSIERHEREVEPEWLRLQPSLRQYVSYYKPSGGEQSDADGLGKQGVLLRYASRANGDTKRLCVSAHFLPRVAPLAHNTAWISMRKNYRCENTVELQFVPYFGDDDKEDVVSEVYEIAARQKELDNGPLWLEDAKWSEAVAVAAAWMDKRRADPGARPGGDDLKLRLLAMLHISQAKADDFLEDVKIAKELGQRDSLSCPSTPSKAMARSPSKKSRATPLVGSGSLRARSGPASSPETGSYAGYEALNESFRLLLCRRCFLYDCQLHSPLQSAASIDLQTEVALHRRAQDVSQAEEVQSDVGEENVPITANQRSPPPRRSRKLLERPSPKSASSPSKQRLLGRASHEVLVERALLVCENNRSLASQLIRIPGSAPPATLPPARPTLFAPKVKQQARKRLEVASAFCPCACGIGGCGGDCSCRSVGNFCSVLCGCPPECGNRFSGCVCTSNCNTRACPCFAAGYECDPDVCGGSCGAGSCGPHSCQNDALSLQRQKHLLLGASSVPGAGWGLFCKKDIRKGDFIGEYRGEEISQDEAERRGRIYDKQNRSYLFNLDSETVLDAALKGNKLRFVNHSERPNCHMRMLVTKGSHRVGMYASHDIPAQTELFFDYRYETDARDSSNKLRKRGVKVDWMRDSRMASQVSKSLKDVYARGGDASNSSGLPPTRGLPRGSRSHASSAPSAPSAAACWNTDSWIRRASAQETASSRGLPPSDSEAPAAEATASSREAVRPASEAPAARSDVAEKPDAKRRRIETREFIELSGDAEEDEGSDEVEDITALIEADRRGASRRPAARSAWDPATPPRPRGVFSRSSGGSHPSPAAAPPSTPMSVASARRPAAAAEEEEQDDEEERPSAEEAEKETRRNIGVSFDELGRTIRQIDSGSIGTIQRRTGKWREVTFSGGETRMLEASEFEFLS